MAYEIPYADPITESIDLYRRSWDDLMRQRIRMENRALDRVTGVVRSEFLGDIAEIIEASEGKVRRQLEKLIRAHPMADWLEGAKTQGARVATVLAMIRNPHRFPSQRCSNGCHLLPTFSEGDQCPSETTPEKDAKPQPCGGIIQARARGTGVRALWHMMGLYPVDMADGKTRLATYRKGVQGSHNREVKSAVLMPQGIAQQFYMQGSRYADVYYESKARLAAARTDKTPGWLDATARVIATKAWAGDLLIEWKQRVPMEGCAEARREIKNTSDASFLAGAA